MKLISMTDFVLQQVKNAPLQEYNQVNETFVNKVVAYAEFLKQSLKLQMFVACDEDDEILFPITLGGQRIIYDEFVHDSTMDKVKEYDEAEKRVLFKDFRIIENNSKSHPKTVQFQNLLNPFWFLTETNSWHISKGLKTLEDLIEFKLDLSDAVSF